MATTVSDRASDWVRIFPPHPITNDSDLAEALKALDGVFHAAPDSGAASYRDLLIRLIEEYQTEHTPEEDPTPRPSDCLRHLMEEHEMTAPQLAEVTNVPEVSIEKFLTGVAALTSAHAAKLGSYFKVDQTLFLEPRSAE